MLRTLRTKSPKKRGSKILKEATREESRKKGDVRRGRENEESQTETLTERLSSDQVESSLHSIRIDPSSEGFENSRVDESLGSIIGLEGRGESKSETVEVWRKGEKDSLERRRRERSGHVFELQETNESQRRARIGRKKAEKGCTDFGCTTKARSP